MSATSNAAREQATLTDTDFGQKTVHVGDHVSDREDDVDATMLVVSRSPVQADEFEIEEGYTVADANPAYPADDKIVQVVFPQAGDLTVDQEKRYAYPRSRLRVEQSVHG